MVGVVFLGADGLAIHSNRVAEEIFRSNDGFSTRNGELHAFDRNADGLVHRAIDHVYWFSVKWRAGALR